MNSSALLSISRLGRPVKSLIILGMVLIGLLLFFLLITLPQTRLLNGLKMQFKAEQKRLETERLQLLSIPEMKSEMSQLKSRYALLQKRLPDGEVTLEIIKQLTEELGRFNIKLISLVPGAGECPEEGINETTIEILMQSNYEAVGRYLEAVRNLPFLFRIKDIAIEREEARGRLNVRLVLATYSLK